jgi:hypothetical protein
MLYSQPYCSGLHLAWYRTYAYHCIYLLCLAKRRVVAFFALIWACCILDKLKVLCGSHVHTTTSLRMHFMMVYSSFQWIPACCSCKVLWTFLICHVLCCYCIPSEFSCCFQKWNRNSGRRFCIMICSDFYCIRMCPHSLELMKSRLMNPLVRSCGVAENCIKNSIG